MIKKQSIKVMTSAFYYPMHSPDEEPTQIIQVAEFSKKGLKDIMKSRSLKKFINQAKGNAIAVDIYTTTKVIDSSFPATTKKAITDKCGKGITLQ